MLLAPNEPLDLVVLDSMRVLFQNELWDRGFGDGVVDTTVVVDTATRLADVRLKLIPGRHTTVGSITIAGNKRVDEATIRNTITFKTGDLYRQSEILESQRSLYESSLFRLATIYVAPQPDSVKKVNIDVTEAPLHEARVGPGLNNVDFGQFQAHYASLQSVRRRATARRQRHGGQSAGAHALGPRLFPGRHRRRPRRRRLAVPAADIRREHRLQTTGIPAATQGRRRHSACSRIAASTPECSSIAATAARRRSRTSFRPRAPVSLNYRYEQNRVEASDVYFCVNFGVCDQSTIRSLRTHQSLSPLGLTGFIDRSDQPFSPTKGYVARVDIENASALHTIRLPIQSVHVRRRGLRTQKPHEARLLGAFAGRDCARAVERD